jgi:hypothetical protein
MVDPEYTIKQNGVKNPMSIIVLLAGLIALFAPVLVILSVVFRYTKGQFMYPFDDTLIHLEMAKNLATAGVWGINPDQFASASSSLLYTVILALLRLLSDSVLLPLLLNAIAAILILRSLQTWLRKQSLSAWGQVLTLFTVIFFTPLPTLVISGMEHTLQCLVCFLFIFHFSEWLASFPDRQKGPLPWQLLALAVLVASVRYEGLFLIGVGVCLLLYSGNFRNAVLLGFVAVLPVVVFGIYSVSKGNYFFPNSVLVKSDNLNAAGFSGFVGNILFEKLTYARNGLGALATQRWAIIMPLIYLAFRPLLRRADVYILIFLMGAVILHLSLAATGTLYRYEAYLFLSCLAFTGYLFCSHVKKLFVSRSFFARSAMVVLLFFLFFPIVLRGLSGIEKTSRACINIYDQQYQMSRFVGKYYNGHPVAANDIGAISYFTSSPIVDLWGLASIEVTRSKRGRYWTPRFLDSLCRSRKVEMAMIYDSWFNDALGYQWRKIATWQIQHNVICGDDVVSFYALDTTDQDFLKKSLREFEGSLPRSVRVSYY